MRPNIPTRRAVPPPLPTRPLREEPLSPGEIVLKPPPGWENRVPVGLLLPLSGPRAALGQSLLDAAQLALFEVADKNFVLMPRDTGGTPAGARKAAESAVESGAKLILGPVFAASAIEAISAVGSKGVNMLAFTNNRAAAGRGTFVMGFLPAQRIRRVVSLAASKGAQQFTALLPEGAYGDGAQRAFIEAVASVGAQVVRIERYKGGTEAKAVKRLGNYDARRAALLQQRKLLTEKDDAISKRALKRLEKLETLGDVEFDAVLLLETGEALKGLAPLLPYYDIDTRKVRILGINDWSARSLRREPTLAGAWYASPSHEASAAFAKRYRQIYARRPSPLAALAYDATALAAVLASREGSRDFSVDSLAASNGFAGSAGLFRLLRSGLVEHSYAVYEVRPGGVTIVSEAPQAFGALSN
ncbi:MAG: penicillin-binding protein activator [Rhodospirillaceae bacterium]|nr:penicillin-binding protein activator [Rhodospirillaceae bacterium]